MLHACGAVIRIETPADVFWSTRTLATDTASYTVQSVETYGDRRQTDRQTDRQRQTDRDRQRQRDRQTQTDTETERQTDRDFIYRRVADLKTVYIQPLPMREYLDQRERQTDRQTDRHRDTDRDRERQRDRQTETLFIEE